ncbi:hypothetical protein NY547_13980 [Cnuibacter physcomitrellae]|uniref:hypothetical protein n=1 Tax=Cnuibacter physcomitrellae TaxID=1619308 RepID=UPI0021760751|nr:hypothetical protein [Cnuibacter physcomitrellae]MCS5498356.1 hypothetical protein [Cnuibacter physcomitrellae]
MHWVPPERWVPPVRWVPRGRRARIPLIRSAPTAQATALGQLPAGGDAAHVAQLLISASYGLFEAENWGFQEIDTENALRDLWRRLLQGLEVADVEAVLAATRVAPGGASAGAPPG